MLKRLVSRDNNSRHVKLNYHILASLYIFAGTMSFTCRSSLSAVAPLKNVSGIKLELKMQNKVGVFP